MLSCLLLQLEGLNFEPGTWNGGFAASVGNQLSPLGFEP